MVEWLPVPDNPKSELDSWREFFALRSCESEEKQVDRGMLMFKAVIGVCLLTILVNVARDWGWL